MAGIQPSIAGEALGSRALALATIGRVDEARSLAEAAVARTRGAEAAALNDAVLAVCAVKVRGPDVVRLCEALLTRALDRGVLDLVVTAYRANAGVLSVLLSSSTLRDDALFLVRRAGDEALLSSLGLSTAAILDPAASLSGREQEVYALVCEGLSNAEIGRRLFIAESTVKAHAHRLFDKLGVHSRTALLLNATQTRLCSALRRDMVWQGLDWGGDRPRRRTRYLAHSDSPHSRRRVEDTSATAASVWN